MGSQSSLQARQYERDGERAMYQSDDALALELYLKALALRRETQNLFAQEENLSIIANLQWRLGRPLEALHSCQELLRVDETVNWPDVRAGILNNMAAIENDLGMHEQAEVHLQKSLDINARQLYDPGLKATCLANLGDAQSALGQLDDSEKNYAAALLLRDHLPHNRAVDIQIKVHIGCGHNAALRGQYDKARSSFMSALHECQKNDRRHQESGVLENLGNLEMRLGNFAGARDHYTSAIRRCPDDPLGQRHLAGLHSSLALAEMRLGDVSKANGDISIDYDEKTTHYAKSQEHFAKSLEHFERANGLHQQIRDPARRARNLVNWSFLYRRISDFAKAQDRLEQALRISQPINNMLLTAEAHVNLSIVLVDQENFSQAQALCSETLKSIEELGLKHTDIAINACVLLGHLLMRDGQDTEAYDFLDKAITQIETRRAGVADEMQRLSLADYKSKAYQSMIEVCHRLRHTDVAKQHEMFYFAEMSKSRALLDQLVHLPISTPKELSVEFVAEVQTLLDSFDTTVALIEFYTLPDKIIAFVLRSGEHEPVVTQVPMDQDRLLSYVKNYWREVIEYPRHGDIGQRWQTLADPLLADVLPHLSEVELVCLVPHGLLHYLPLHALWVDGRYLIDRFPITYAPSAAVLDQVIQRRASEDRTELPGTLVAGNPTLDLPFAEIEARQVAKFFGVQPYLRESATKAAIQPKLAGKDVIHLACHGRFEPMQPLQSGVFFANEEKLTAQEIVDLSLRADLVTLGACETARAQIGDGDEVVGLTWALLHAGASSALVSLWAVHDESTGQLMTDFYHRLYNDAGHKVKAKATALQEAMLEMRKKKDHPYYWAPFILVGDWR